MELTDAEAAFSPTRLLAGEISRRALLAVIGAASLLRLVAVFAIHWEPAFDDAWYFRTARELAEGRGYLDDAHHATAYFPVGYPATLAALSWFTGSSLLAGQLLNVVFAAGTLWCIYLLVRTVGGGSKLAVAAAALFGFLPSQIISCCVTMSEITFTFALTLGVLLALQPVALRRPVWWLLVGLVFGWATLIRSQVFLLPLLIVPIVVHLKREPGRSFFRRSASRLVWVAAGMVVVVGPWTYRNYRVFDAFVLVSTNGGDNLYIGNNPTSSGRYQEPGRIYPQGQAALQLPELERDHLGRELARAYIKAHPVETLLRVPSKLWYMYRSDLGVTNWVWEYNTSGPTALYYLSQGLTQGAYTCVIGLGSLWLLLSLRRSPKNVGVDTRLLQVLSLTCVAYFSGVTAVFFGDARYHQPLLPVFAIGAAHFLASVRWPTRQRLLP
jgi:hypothetical protein